MIIPFSIFILLPSCLIAYWGRNRKLGFWGYLFACVLLTPLVGLLLVIISAPSTTPKAPSQSWPS